MKIFALAACALLASLSAATASAAVKWHPGHYVMMPGGASLSQLNSYIKEIGGVSAIKGIQVRIWWHELERSKGSYNFSKIDALLKTLKAQPTPKRLVVRIMDRKFGGSSSGIVPDYLRTSTYNGGLVKTRVGYAARLWESNVMDRLIALYKAMGSRYDDDSYFEGITSEETTLGLGNTPSGYSHAKLAAQYERLVRQAGPAMPRTNLFLYTNYIGSTSLMEDIFQTIHSTPTGAGSSNIIPDSMSLGQKVWTGGTGTDYRGRLALGASVETAEIGGSKGDYTPRQIANYAYDKLRVNYVFWVRNTWSGDSSQRWSTGILPFLKTNPPIRTNCPTAYGSCAR
jgi:hypothetical protein